MTDKPWSERIPTAIADGARLTAGHDAIGLEGARGFVNVTASEVAAMKALWGMTGEINDDDCPEDECGYCDGIPVLRDFTLKMEALSGD